jgi:hypothetical protein
MPSGSIASALGESFVHRLAGYTNDISNEFSKGDKVTWKSHGNTVTGAVEEKITADTTTAGRTVRASRAEPQYRVRSDKSGRDAVHKPESLHRAN